MPKSLDDLLAEDEWALVRYYQCRPQKDMDADTLRNYFPVLDAHDPDGEIPHCQDFRELAETYLKHAEGKMTGREVDDWESARKQERLKTVLQRAKQRIRDKSKDTAS